MELLRVGRQQLFDTPELILFDGARLETEDFGKSGVNLGLYGGIPTHLYESSSDGDQVVGAYAQARPWSGGRVRLDWMHLDDELYMNSYENDLFGLGLWQSVGQNLMLEGRFFRLENENRDVRLAANWYDPEIDLQVRASYYNLLETQTAQVTEFDPFYLVLADYFPFDQSSLMISKGLGEHVNLSAGTEFRNVSDVQDEGPYNRDYERYYATLGLIELFDAGVSFSVTGDLWDAGDYSVNGWGAELDKQFGEAILVGMGTYYSLYKYSLMASQEQDNVRTWYARTSLRRGENTSFDLFYEYEDDDPGVYHQLRLGATWRF